MPTEPVELLSNSAQDTCDLCGPGVLASVWACRGERELGYCGHCGTRFKAGLTEWADVVHDLTYIARGG